MSKIDIKKYVRPSCRGFEPYVAGKPIETIKRELGLKRVIKLASNENALGPSMKARKVMNEAINKIYFYPDSNSFSLSKAIADKFGVKQQNVMYGSGSDELIEIIARTFFNASDEIVVSEHAFTRYKMAGDLMGSKVVEVPMKGFAHDLDAMAEKCGKKTKALFIANPNNPTGTYNTKTEVERFLKKLERKFGSKMPLVVMDEAYYEYASVNKDYPRTVRLIKKYPTLIVLRTFSKIYGLAGLRVGYGFAFEGVVDYINRVRPPFNVNLMGQAAAAASLTDLSQVRRSLMMNEKEKKFLYKQFKNMGVEFIPSATNFILFNSSPVQGGKLFKKLLLEGVIVRAMDEYKYPYMVRVSIGLPEENRIFIEKLKKVLCSSCKCK